MVDIDITLNDGDVPSDGTLDVSDPANGTVTIDDGGTPDDPSDDIVTYIPDTDFNGTDTFNYTICDNASPANCSTATVTITVTPTPDAVDDTATVSEDDMVDIDITANDGDVPSDGTLDVSDPANGTVTIDDGGTPDDPSDDIVTYIPDADFNGTDTFNYTICDNASPANCSTATVTITVTPTPDAVDDTATVSEDDMVDIDITLNDGDVPSDGTLDVSDPSNGTVTIDDGGTPDDPSDDIVTYIPDADFNGTDTFNYTICDNASPANCSTATVTITVTPTPDAVDDTATVSEDDMVDIDITVNDGDVPSDGTLDVSDPANGTVTIDDGGTPDDPSDDIVTYIPDADFNGTDTFNYTICDNASPANCSTATVTVIVTPTPDAVDDTATVSEDDMVDIDITANDGDVPSDGTLDVSDPANGTVTIDDGGTPDDPSDDIVTYIPDADFNGTDTFNYTICDNASPANCSTATVAVIVTPTPDAVDDTATVSEDDMVDIDITLNDGDVPSDGTLDVSDPANGTVTIDDGGTPDDPSDDIVTYIPDADFNGTDTFNYTICDNASPANCSTATVTITVTPTPDAVDDTATVTEDDMVDIDITANDGDVPSDGTLDVSDPANGTVTIDDGGTPDDPSDDIVTYIPDADFNGTDTFNYTICDNASPANCSTATVTITVTPTPDAVDDTATVSEDDMVDIDITVNDGDVPSDGTLDVSDPANGTVTIDDGGTPDDPSDDIVTYIPDADFNGTDTFNYTICDNASPANCSTATVTVIVTPTPDAVDDTATVSEDDMVDIDITANDGDVPSDGTLDVSDPANGTVTIDDGGTPDDPSDDIVTYIPDADFNGTDTFTYTICDNASPANCSTATVTITVIPVDEAPVAVDDTATVAEDDMVDIDIYANDTNVPDNGTLTVTNPTNGTVTIDDGGTPDDPSDDIVTYIPDADFNGTDTFTYTVCDNASPANCTTATVTITVIPTPDAVDDTATTNVGEDVNIDVTDNDNDIPDDGTIDVTDPGDGTVDVDDGGTPNDPSDDIIIYTPNDGFSGTDTFTYTICDNLVPQNCTTATVTVVVLPTETCLSPYNLMSPGDGNTENEFFFIPCIDSPEYANNTVEIFNRWGNTVYKISGYSNTDSSRRFEGISNGRATISVDEKLPVGTYYYVIDPGNGESARTGWLYINK